jgi:signal peptidase I
MKTLKLEVGKTYRSREGEEVKIIRKNNNNIFPYQGSNGEWYYEGGKWSHFAEEHPKDLVEEVPETSHTFGLVPEALTSIRYTFDIPDGMKKGTVSQEGNRIIVEMVPEERKEPKPGDVMINKHGSVYIFKSVIDDHSHEHYVWLGTSGRLAIDTKCDPGRPATPEEAQPLWDALKKAGKRWNAETMQVEDIEPKPGDVMINKLGSVYIFKSVRDDGRYHNCFAWLGKSGGLLIGESCYPGRPATSEEAQTLFDALKKAGKQWNPETMQVEDIPEIDHICEWVEKHLNCRYYSHESLTKVIYDYLKYREGEK